MSLLDAEAHQNTVGEKMTEPLEEIEKKTISQLNEENLTLHKLVAVLNNRISELEAQLSECRELRSRA